MEFLLALIGGGALVIPVIDFLGLLMCTFLRIFAPCDIHLSERLQPILRPAPNRTILRGIRDPSSIFENPVNDVRDRVDDVMRTSIGLDVVVVLSRHEQVRQRVRCTLIKVVAMVELAVLGWY